MRIRHPKGRDSALPRLGEEEGGEVRAQQLRHVPLQQVLRHGREHEPVLPRTRPPSVLATASLFMIQYACGGGGGGGGGQDADQRDTRAHLYIHSRLNHGIS
jgi:hypothetical protein